MVLNLSFFPPEIHLGGGLLLSVIYFGDIGTHAKMGKSEILQLLGE